MSGKKLTAFGFALGIERLFELMDISKMPKKQPLYLHITANSKFIENARNEVNLQYQNDFVKGMKYANQIGADFIIFEKDGKLLQKNLASGEQLEVND